MMSVCTVALALTLAWVPNQGIARADTGSETSSAPGRTLTAPSSRPVTPDEAAAYERREKKASPQLARFAGGDTIIIGATTAVLVLLVVVILILVL